MEYLEPDGKVYARQRSSIILLIPQIMKAEIRIREKGSDQQCEERCGSYSPSADISKSEFSSSGSSCRWYKAEENRSLSSSRPSSPISAVASSRVPGLVLPPIMFPVIGGKDVVVWDEKLQKCAANLSGLYSV
ncbi:rop guanine nucleotide exchange factor 1 [Forsythia ovata]|uniref:Rop guanine nucleotide exchange factor 1 n=1 Tax=Forsythia ovata TaxID=205694 RepID=A0ABD1XD67_9LAMI